MSGKIEIAEELKGKTKECGDGESCGVSLCKG